VKSQTNSTEDADTEDSDDQDDDDEGEAGGSVSQQISFRSSSREMIPHSISF
jgi:hypothetical protein